MNHLTHEVLKQGYRAIEAEHEAGNCTCAETNTFAAEDNILRMIAGLYGSELAQGADPMQQLAKLIAYLLHIIEAGLQARADSRTYPETDMEHRWNAGPGRVVEAVYRALRSTADPPAPTDSELAELRRIAGIKPAEA